jgi:hypothetical protein
LTANLPPPKPPTNFTVVGGISYATLNFTPPYGASYYIVTATPTTNTHEAAFTRAFTGGSGYKLELLTSKTTYTLSLVAANSSGSSTAVTKSVTTRSGFVTASPTLTYTTTNFPAANVQGFYSYLAIPKTNPNIVYIYAFDTRTQLYYSTNGGTTFVDISGRLSLSGGTGAGAGLACSDDGKYVYVQPDNGRTNISTDYGATFSYKANADTPNADIIQGTLCTNPTGEISFVAGNTVPAVGTNNGFIINWSADYGNTYKYKTGSSSVFDLAINAFSNRVYYTNYPTSGTLYYYTAASKTDLLALDFTNATFTTVNLTNIIYRIVSVNDITVAVCNGANVFLSTDGTTFTAVTYFSSSPGNTLIVNQRTWVVIEPYVGFIMIGGISGSTKYGTTLIFYSIDKGLNWSQYVPSPAITGASSATCFLRDTNVNVLITSGEGKLYKVSIPITINDGGDYSGVSTTNLLYYFKFIDNFNNYKTADAPSYYDISANYGGTFVNSSLNITNPTSTQSQSASANYVQLKSFATVDAGTTIAFWVKASDTNAGWARVFDFGGGSSVNNLFMYLSNATIGYGFYGVSSGNNNGGVIFYTFTANTWFHVAWTISSTGSHNIYVNGTKKINGATIGWPNRTTRPLNYIGRSNWGGDWATQSMNVGEFRIYKTELSATDVATLATYGTPP